MKLNEVKPARGAVRRRKRLGLGTGSGSGGTCTRGTKGLYSRSGGKLPNWFEGGQMPLQRRIPKRGFKNFNRTAYQVVNIKDLGRFDAGSEIGPADLLAVGLIRKGPAPIKLLAVGTLEHALTVRVHAASKAAVEKVTQSGGRVEILSGSGAQATESAEA
jgi:large subunit ribosomal protein L15